MTAVVELDTEHRPGPVKASVVDDLVLHLADHCDIRRVEVHDMVHSDCEARRPFIEDWLLAAVSLLILDVG